MRKTITMIVAAALVLLVMAAGVAVARQAFIDCTGKSPDVDGGDCRGTKGDDRTADKDGDRCPDRGIQGTDYDDRIVALSGDDRADGFGGEDTVEGGGGNDCAEGGYGDDTLYGGKGRDTLRDTDPGSLDPGLTGDSDTIYGGPDADKIDVSDGFGDDTVSCGSGKDVVFYDKSDTGSDEIADDCEVLEYKSY